MQYKKVFKYLISVIIITGLIFYVSNDEKFHWHYFSDISGLLVYLLLTLFWSYLSGLQLYILLQKQNVKLKLIDQLLLPMSMALSGYIIPANGGMLFSLYYFKKKYNLNSLESVSIGVYVIYISLLLSGVFGLVYCFLYKKNVVVILTMSVLFILFPFIIKKGIDLIGKINNKRFKIIERIIDVLSRIVNSTNRSLIDKGVFSKIIGLNLLMIILNIVSMYWLMLILHVEAPFVSVVLIVLFLRLSSIIRILPGNFGIDELFAGGIFLFFGLTASDGILISVYSRIVSLVFLIIPLGVTHIFLNRAILTIADLKKIKQVYKS